MPDTRLVIFDLDGTLVDSMEHYTALFARLLAERHGLNEAFSRAIYESLLGLPPGRQFTDALTRSGHGTETVDELTAAFWAVAEVYVPPVFPEVPSVLEALKNAGYALVVSSGGRPAVAQYRAHQAGIEGFFDLILGTDEMVPDMAKGPGHFAIMQEALNLWSDEFRARSAFVGDGVYDIQVARDAGLPAIARVTDASRETLRRAGADYVIDDLTGLRSVLDAIERGRSTSAPAS